MALVGVLAGEAITRFDADVGQTRKVAGDQFEMVLSRRCGCQARSMRSSSRRRKRRISSRAASSVRCERCSSAQSSSARVDGFFVIAAAAQPIEQRRVANHQLTKILTCAEKLNYNFGGARGLDDDLGDFLSVFAAGDEAFEVRQCHARVRTARKKPGELADEGVGRVVRERQGREVAQVPPAAFRDRGRPVRREPRPSHPARIFQKGPRAFPARFC